MNQASEIETRGWVVSGRVQGVGYRRFVELAALKRGIRGWVRNLVDGGVEIAVTGPSDKVREMEAIVSRGPAFARVDNVENVDVPHYIRSVKTFEIK